MMRAASIACVFALLAVTFALTNATTTDEFLLDVGSVDIQLRSDDDVPAAVSTVQGLVSRLLPFHTEHFSFKLDSTLPAHTFNIDNGAEEGAIVISGTDGVALSSGLYHYLKYVCGAHVSWSGDQLSTVPSVLPKVDSPITRTSNVEYRYYQNVCTVSYSMVWWDWARWEREIDWMALHGINLPLAFTGQEYVWQKTWEQFTMDAGANNFFTSPAFLAWGRMGNVRGLFGPLSQHWIDSQMQLQKLILKRMRDYGMRPVLPAFAGFVPEMFKTILYPQANITASSNWNGFHPENCCTLKVEPFDPLFKEIGSTFIKLQTEIYGTDNIYNCDLFNEMEPPSSDPSYLAATSKAIYEAMTAADSKAEWLMQGWLFQDTAFWKPAQIQGLLSGVPDDKMMILDLFAEVNPIWSRTENFYGKSYIWCMLHNYGGNLGTYGVVDSVTSEPFKALKSEKSTMKGIGITMEGIEQNPVMYEMALEMAWHSDTVDPLPWMQTYASARYGMHTDEAAKAWEMMRGTVYNCTTGQFSVTKSMIVVAPNMQLNHTGFMPTELFYDPIVMVKVAKLMLNAARNNPQILMSNPFRYDLVDFTRQTLSDLFIKYHANLVHAFTAKKSTDEIAALGAKLTGLIKDMDVLMSSNEHFLLGTWVRDARYWGKDDQEKDFLEFNAKNQITTWGLPDSHVRDYATKQWGGLIGDFYHTRWSMFVDALVAASKAGNDFVYKPFFEEIQKFEDMWQWKHRKNPSTYPVVANGNSVDIVNNLLEKYVSDMGLPSTSTTA
eukprot:GFYU01019105.1.p1 GENE.GFYU01019105.1~~GFYU01019105.1.p1  ORF type:complete len:777 (+),score=252.94 GFYU01019105.1:67-2397(+)